MSIGSRIKEARKNRGFTQEEVASIVGITKGSVANYENGVSTPKLDILLKVMSALNVDANYLYQDDMAEFLIQPDQAPPTSLTPTDLRIAHAYHDADTGTQTSVRKLLDVSDNPVDDAIEKEVASYRTELEAVAKGAEECIASPDTKMA